MVSQRDGGPGLPTDRIHRRGCTRRCTSPEERTRRHGPSEEALTRVVEFLESKGLRVHERSAGRRRIVAESEAGKVNAAFGITLTRFRRPVPGAPRPTPGERPQAEEPKEETYRVEGLVQVPAELIELVRAVIGLDNRQIGYPATVDRARHWRCL